MTIEKLVHLVDQQLGPMVVFAAYMHATNDPARAGQMAAAFLWSGHVVDAFCKGLANMAGNPYQAKHYFALANALCDRGLSQSAPLAKLRADRAAEVQEHGG